MTRTSSRCCTSTPTSSPPSLNPPRNFANFANFALRLLQPPRHHRIRRIRMKLKIAVLAGDGIGPEVTREATQILKAVAEFGGHDFAFTEALIGGVAITAEGTPLPKATIDVALDADAVLLGAVGDNKFY